MTKFDRFLMLGIFQRRNSFRCPLPVYGVDKAKRRRLRSRSPCASGLHDTLRGLRNALPQLDPPAPSSAFDQAPGLFKAILSISKSLSTPAHTTKPLATILRQEKNNRGTRSHNSVTLAKCNRIGTIYYLCRVTPFSTYQQQLLCFSSSLSFSVTLKGCFPLSSVSPHF